MNTPATLGQWCAALLVGLCLAALPASAVFSGLTLIPTADVLDAGTYDTGFQLYGDVPSQRTGTYLLDTQVGVLPGVEAGADYDFSSGAPTRLLLNAKYRLPLAESWPSVAAGLYNVGRHVQAVPYVVATQPLGALRGHLGAARLTGNTEALLGLDYALTDRWTAVADYTTGSGNYLTGGAVYQATEQLWVLAALLAPNGGGATEFSLQVGLGGRCWQCRTP